MERFYFVKPTLEHQQQAKEYIQEFYEYNSKINGVGGLHKYLKNDKYEEWLAFLEKTRYIEPSENSVPGETFFLIRENDSKIIGMITIRLVLNDNLRKLGGNIGYSIRSTERRKGYGKINLFLALLKCQQHNIKKVMIDCDKDNIGSAKTILALNGIIEKEWFYEKENKIIQTYWINTDETIKQKRKDYEIFIVKE